MALDIFIKNYTVEGETQESKHKKEIDILSWSWGIGNGGSLMWAVAPEGNVNVQDLPFRKMD
jgi:type VI secretion system secreted protein Hcp